MHASVNVRSVVAYSGLYLAQLETGNVCRLNLLTFLGDHYIIEFKRERSRTQRRGDVTYDAVMTSLMICCGFFVCWSPNAFYNFLMSIHYISGIWALFYNLVTMMVLVNSCINPLIYAAKYGEFQRGVRRMLRKQVEPSSVQPVDMQMGGVSGH